MQIPHQHTGRKTLENIRMLGEESCTFMIIGKTESECNGFDYQILKPKSADGASGWER